VETESSPYTVIYASRLTAGQSTNSVAFSQQRDVGQCNELEDVARREVKATEWAVKAQEAATGAHVQA
jgi:hypothetical protein